MKNIKLLGISGTNGSGKDSLGEMLAKRHGWLFVSVADLLREEARRRGLPIERENLRAIGVEWRREFGLGVLVDKAFEQFNQSKDKYKGLAVVPMRNPGEAQRVKELGGKLVWIDADPKIRYKRISSRLRSAEDNKTFEQFTAEEEIEMRGTDDEAAPKMIKVKEMCDLFLENNGDDIENFKNQAEKALKSYL
jgi:dephospho-CoA kinase